MYSCGIGCFFIYVKVPVEVSPQLGNHGKKTKETCTFKLFSLDSYFISVVSHLIEWLIYLHDQRYLHTKEKRTKTKLNQNKRWITCPWVWRRKKIYEFQNRENVIILIVNSYFQPLSYVIWCCGTKSECTFDIFLCIYSDFLWFCGRQRIVNNIQDGEGW